MFCLGDACNVAQNGPACIDITAGNLTDITAFQADIDFEPGQLFYQSITTFGLSNNIAVNVQNAGKIRLLFFQPDQTGNTVADGTIIATVCFTNQTTNVTNLTLSELSARDVNSQAVPVEGNGGTVNGCGGVTPTCSDGIMNGNETGVDCGGPDCAACPPVATCSDGIMNGNETGIDCGGPDCAACPTGTGGPDLDCGQGTTDLVLCFGDACNVAPGGTACLDITAGNLTNITAFQADLVTNTGELTFLNWTDAGNLSNPIIANVSTGTPRLLFFQPDQSGNTVADGTIIGTACFTNQTAAASVASLTNLTARDSNGETVNISGSTGTVNDCSGTTTPTCSDGIMNGNETGVDCGGPDCAACPTGTGGPDLNCGEGTTDVSFCLGDVCDVPLNGTACVDLTVGNFTNITAFQADVIFDASQLTFVSWTDAGNLSNPTIANLNGDTPRLLFFQPNQTGNTVAGGTIVGTLCFTNLNPEVSTVSLDGITARDNNGVAQPTTSGSGSVNACVPMGPTCSDGIMNGNETGVDCGGPDCPACPTCNDGIMNGDETGVDCGGSDCAPCVTVCGENTTDVEFCLGNVCADAGAMACLPVFIGNFNDLAGFQFELSFDVASLTYSEVVEDSDLGDILQVSNPSDGRLVVQWNDVSTQGQTLPAEDALFEICFTAQNITTTTVSFLNPDATVRAFNELGQQLPASPGSNGTINGNGCGDTGPTCDDGIMNGQETGVDCGGPDCDDCPPVPTCDDGIMNGQETGVDCGGPDCADCPPVPTCDDGIMNGQETGVDCGGPDCAACPTGGGPDTDCGEGTTDVTLCLGDVCNVPAGGEACIALTAGNFVDVTAFQADININDGELTFQSWTDAGNLGTPIIANASSGNPRLLLFQPNQTGITVANGTVLGTLCYTNLNGTNTSEVNVGNLTARDNAGNDIAISGSSGFVNNCTTMGGPTCEDGMMNGQETGVDCGGPDCPDCPTAGISFTVQDGSGAIGETVCVDVTTADFTDITELDLTVNFNTSVLQLTSVTAASGLPGLGAGNFSTSGGQIVLDYASGTPRTLPDGAPLFTICWEVLTGDETNVALSNVAATNDTGVNPTVTTNNGVINAGGVSQNLSFRVGNATGGVGQEVCVPISTDNFTNAVGLQFATTYNPERLAFVSAVSTNALQGLQINNDTEEGVIRALWADFGAMPNDLPNGTVLFDACFTVLQACQTPVVIEDFPGLPVRVTNGDNESVMPIDLFPGVINNGIPCDVMPPSNLVLDLGTASGSVGQEVCVDLTVQNFTSLTDLSFSIVYDPAIVSFASATNFGLGSISAANVNGNTDGVITFDWDAVSSAGQSLADGSVLFSLCFTIDALAATNVSFANSPTVIQARNGDGQNVGIIPSGGNINPNVIITDGMTIDIGDATGAVGDQVCLPLTVFDPSPITGFQFTITYDPAILEYVPGNNMFSLSGFLGINSNTPGILRVLWDEPTAMATTPDNGSTLFQICFNILSEDPAVVTFSDTPTAIEFSLGTNEVEVDLFPGQVNGGAAPMIVSADVSNPSCFGDSDGSISLNVTGGANLQYTWSPDVSNGPVATGLAAGTYSVTVTNPETAQFTSKTYTLSTLPFNVNVAQTTGVTCNGAADGSITIETVGGASPFLIDWSGGLQDGLLTQTNLDSGSYSVTVTDNNGCSMSQTNINIGEPTPLNVSGTPIDITDDPGGVNIVVVGGRPGYTYAWTGPNNYTSTEKDIMDVTEAGTYCVTVTDLNNCTDVQCFAISAGLGADVVIEGGCFGEDNACIDITPTGGNGTYSYRWSVDGDVFATTQDVCDLAPGDYSVNITSGTAEVTLTIEVSEPDMIAGNGTVTPASTGDNGTITLTPTGGNPGYSFAWADGPTTQNRTGLTSGEYCVTITDGNDCSVSECYTVGAADVTFTSTSTRPASCSDGEDGVIRLVINNGARPFTVQIEPLGTVVEVDSNIIEVLVPAGTYEVIVTDAQGATLMTNETVGAPAAITATGTVTSDTEDTNCSGMISLAIAGGTADYTVNWNSLQAGATISQLCPGEYTATVTDANGCTFTTETFVVALVEEELVSITDVSCEDGTDGSIDVTVSGGVEPYIFSWTLTGDATEIANTEDLTNAGAGDYTLTITDATGARLTKNYTIGIAAGFTVTATVTSNYNGFGVSCPDANDGTAVAVISGQGSFDFEWFRNDETVDTDSILNDAVAGTYLLIVTSGGGCELERTVEITAPDNIVLEAEIQPISCGDTNDGMISVAPTGGVSPYFFEWSTGSTSRQITSLGQGTYGLTVTDGNGCIAETSFTLEEPENLLVTFEPTPATEGCNGSIQVLPLGGSGSYTYFWPQLPNQGNNPLAEGLCPGEYTVEVTDNNGCQTETMIARIEDRRFPCLSAREVITPNGDGLNEAFILFCSEDETVSDNSLEVYNRWGQLVFETVDYDCSADDGSNCFTGETNDGTQLAAGPYYYIFNYTNEFQEQRQQRGSLTIVRE